LNVQSQTTADANQDRVTDHRIGFSVKNAQAVMEGDALEEILDKLKEQVEKEALEEMMEQGP
jgi:protein subunit release factor A